MSDHNPYQSPGADVNAPPPAVEPAAFPAAGLGARILNFALDNILIVIIASTAAAFLPLPSGGAMGDTELTLLVIATTFGYYVILESLFGATLAKLITGTRVMRLDGRRPNVGQIIARTLARYLPFEPLSVVFAGLHQGWHDSLSGTRVVRVRR
jgi:uncharacterized RDD family membrane protein YckC